MLIAITSEEKVLLTIQLFILYQRQGPKMVSINAAVTLTEDVGGEREDRSLIMAQFA